jgi:hypothetical protein
LPAEREANPAADQEADPVRSRRITRNTEAADPDMRIIISRQVILIFINNAAEKEHNSHAHHKNDNFDLDSKDPSNNISYEEKGVMKISNDIIVPDYLVSLLIGKSGEIIRGIMNKSGCMIAFQKEVR